MSALGYAVTDSMTMLRRNLRRMQRYPSMTAILVAMPLVLLLLFVYVFGGTLGAGIGGPAIGSGGRAAYVEYVLPGIILLALTSTAQGVAITVAMDMSEGIIARFRTMAISRAAVLTGHVVGSVIQALLAVAVVLGVGVLIGFRPDATPVEWLGVLGLLTLVALALTWLSVALGMISKSVESASNIPMPLMLLPFFGSGFVPTDSLPTGLRWFAEYQPFTPIIETLRGLLSGAPIGTSGYLAAAWCVGITLVGYLWARTSYQRLPNR
ncbi:ABC transporter permease [Plantactinospora sp. B24E8]|uniref:ABC transporter permease n=1 Tax=Plantactinospora sp. B24E8 TaxID=3153567 RepID=UPI00325F62C6